MLVDLFNDGEIDRVVDGFASDIEIAIPIYRVGEESGPPSYTGKEDLARLLLARYETGSRIEIVSLTDDASGAAITTINSSRRGLLAVTFQFNEQGLARRLSVFMQ